MAYQKRDKGYTESAYGFAEYTVYDIHYEKIGKVDDIFVGGSGRPEYVGVKTGFLETRYTLIPVEIVRVNDKRRLIEVAADREVVEEGPTFGDDSEITPEFERRVLSYYKIESRQAPVAREGYDAYYLSAAGGERVEVGQDENVEAHEYSSEKHSGTARIINRYPGIDDLNDGDELGGQRTQGKPRAGARERGAGSVNVRKRVRMDREQFGVPEKRQEARVKHVPAEQGTDTSEPETVEDNEIRVPVIEEEIVVKRRPVVKEELRIRKEVVEEEQVIEEDVRKEEVDIDDQSKRRGSIRNETSTDGVTVRRLPRETRNKTEPEERRGKAVKTDRKKMASEGGQRQHAADAEAAAGERGGPPIVGYNDLTVEEIKKKLDGLSEGELEKIRSYEKKHKDRKTLVEWLDRKTAKEYREGQYITDKGKEAPNESKGLIKGVVGSKTGKEDLELEKRRAYHVTTHPDGGWRVDAEGASRASSVHPTKEGALARARELAKGHEPSRLLVYREDDTLQTEQTYG